MRKRFKNDGQWADKRFENDRIFRDLAKIDETFIEGLTFKQFIKVGVNRKFLWFWTKRDVLKITRNKELLALWTEAIETYKKLVKRGYYEE